MKVAILIEVWPPYFGGGIVHVWELARRLVTHHGCEVDVVTRALADDAGATGPAQETHLDGRLRVWRLGPPGPFPQVSGRLAFLVRATAWLLRHRVDLIHAHAFLPGIPAKIARALRRVPVVFTVHGTSLFTPTPAGLRKRLERGVEKWLVTRARYDHLITVAANFRQLPNRNERITVIPNGVDMARFHRPLPWPEQFRLLYVGRFDPVKGVDLLIEALAELKQRGRTLPLTLIGFGPEEPRLRELAVQRGVDGQVTFAGKVLGDALMEAYGRCSLFVLPSLSEGQPLTLLEAWAARRPVLATAVGDNPVHVRDGENGFLVPPGDARALADAIEKALRRNDLAQMGERGWAMVREQFNWDRVAAETFAIYRGLSAARRDNCSE